MITLYVCFEAFYNIIISKSNNDSKFKKMWLNISTNMFWKKNVVIHYKNVFTRWYTSIIYKILDLYWPGATDHIHHCSSHYFRNNVLLSMTDNNNVISFRNGVGDNQEDHLRADVVPDRQHVQHHEPDSADPLHHSIQLPVPLLHHGNRHVM